MAESLGTAVLDLTTNMSGLSGGLAKARSAVEAEVATMAQKTQVLGATLTKTLTVVAAALALAFAKAFQEWDAGVDAIRVGTGATGEELKKLEGSFKRVAGNVTQPLSEVGAVMSELAQRTGLTGKPLEDLSVQILNLARITGGDAQASVAGITRLFGDWGIETEQMTPTLDKLFRTSQATGIGVQKLSELMVQFGSPLRNLGLDFDTSAAMFAKFEQEGVNIQTVMPGLKMALKNFAQAGREPADALQETFVAMQNAKSESELMTIAFDTFGARAGPDLAAAVREGRFEFDSLIEVMNNGSDTVAKATDDTSDLSDTLAKWRNRIIAVIGPYGEMGAVILGAVATIGPALFGLGVLMDSTTGKMIAAWASNAVAAVTASGTIVGAIGVTMGALASFAVAAAPWIAATALAVGTWNELNKVMSQTPWPEVLAKLDELDAQLKAGTITNEQYTQATTDMNMSLGDRIKTMLHSNEVQKAASAALADEAMLLRAVQAEQARGVTETERASKALLNFAGMTSKEFREWRQSTVDSLNGVEGKLEELAGRSKLTADDILRSFTRQLEAMRDYEDNWTKLVGRGLPDDFAKQIQEMGLEGANFVAALASANRKEFDKIVAKWQEAGTKASELSNVVGSNISEGVAKGIESSAPFVVGAMIGVVEAAINAAKKRALIQSPSRVFMAIGAQLVEGLAVGMRRSGGLAVGAASATVEKVVAGFERLGEHIQKQMDRDIEKIKNQLEKALDDDKLTKAQRDALRDHAQAQIDRLRDTAQAHLSLVDDIERRGSKLAGRLQDLADRLRSFKDLIKNAFDFSLQGAFGDGSLDTPGEQMRAHLSRQLSQAREFATVLKDLANSGASQGLIAQIAGAGTVEGLQIGRSLLNDLSNEGQSLGLIGFANDALTEIAALTGSTSGLLGKQFFGEEMDVARTELQDFARDLREVRHAMKDDQLGDQLMAFLRNLESLYG